MDISTAIDDLMAEASALVERGAVDPVERTLLRDDLADAAARCSDPAVVADACDMLARLDRTDGSAADARRLPLAS